MMINNCVWMDVADIYTISFKRSESELIRAYSISRLM